MPYPPYVGYPLYGDTKLAIIAVMPPLRSMKIPDNIESVVATAGLFSLNLTSLFELSLATQQIESSTSKPKGYAFVEFSTAFLRKRLHIFAEGLILETIGWLSIRFAK